EDVGCPVFSRDGNVWAYRLKHKNVTRAQVLVSTVNPAGERIQVLGEPFDSVSDPVLNADGSLVAYAGGKGSRRYLVRGKGRKEKFSIIARISFGPDGKTVAFLAGQYGKQFVIAGESRSDEVDEIVNGPVWSADGKKVAFTARNGVELWSRVLEVK